MKTKKCEACGKKATVKIRDRFNPERILVLCSSCYRLEKAGEGGRGRAGEGGRARAGEGGRGRARAG